MVTIEVDGLRIAAASHESVLYACLTNGIYIPNLCFIEKSKDSPASCRLCFVAVDGLSSPVASCKLRARDGMVIRTRTEAVLRLQRTAFRLIMSAHRIECRACPARRDCPLHRIARHLGTRLKSDPFEPLERGSGKPPYHPFFYLLPERCVLCHRCLAACEKENGSSILAIIGRSFGSTISASGIEEPESLPCPRCGKCVDACPVSAILWKVEAPDLAGR